MKEGRKRMITYKMITNQGGREVNEDSATAAEVDGNYCFVLADGLGGHGKGEVASALVVETVKQIFQQYQEADFLEKSFETAQQNLLDEQKRQDAQSKMKTTMVVLTFVNGQVRWGHIGDSRLYYFHKRKLVKHTLDHSVPQMLVMAGEIKEKQIRGHEDRNRLLRVMGVEWGEARYTLADPIPIGSGQAYLLCSDGFWELIEEKTMQQLLKKSHSVEEWVDMMTAEVKKNGVGKNMDNYTAIGVWVEE